MVDVPKLHIALAVMKAMLGVKKLNRSILILNAAGVGPLSKHFL